jgi:hypothetical protein
LSGRPLAWREGCVDLASVLLESRCRMQVYVLVISYPIEICCNRFIVSTIQVSSRGQRKALLSGKNQVSANAYRL